MDRSSATSTMAPGSVWTSEAPATCGGSGCRRPATCRPGQWGPAVARSRDIGVTTVETEDLEGYQTLIAVEVETERGRREVCGTLIHDGRPRVVRIRGIEIEARLADHMLYLRNSDTPGFIGALGGLLGDAGVNIATFHLGRDRPGGDAIAMLEVDGPVPEAVLRRIRALPQVLQVKALAF